MRYRHRRGKHEAPKPILTINLHKISQTTLMIIFLGGMMFFLGSFSWIDQPTARATEIIHMATPITFTPPFAPYNTVFQPDIPNPLTPTESTEEEVEEESIEEPIPAEEVEPILPEEPEEPSFDLESSYGQDTITTPDGHTLTRYDLPDVYHPGIDFSSVQTYMAYTVIKDRSSAAYKIAYHENAYTDELGFRRFDTDETYFTINDQEDDYMIALGTYYKPKGTCGDRWLIVTDNGSYTAITGDEKSDLHTDSNHQYKPYGNQANVIEFLIDRPSLCKEVKSRGSVTCLEKFSGTILYMYRID